MTFQPALSKGSQRGPARGVLEILWAGSWVIILLLASQERTAKVLRVPSSYNRAASSSQGSVNGTNICAGNAPRRAPPLCARCQKGKTSKELSRLDAEMPMTTRGPEQGSSRGTGLYRAVEKVLLRCCTTVPSALCWPGLRLCLRAAGPGARMRI